MYLKNQNNLHFGIDQVANMNPTYFETKNNHIAYIPKRHMHLKKYMN